MTERTRSLSILIHGPSKVGKSTLSVTAPAPRLLCDVESASRFLPIKPIAWNPNIETPPAVGDTWDTAIVETRSWGDVERVYQWLNSGQHPFRSLIIDSVSELQSRFIEDTSGRQAPDLRDWGTILRGVAGLLRDIRDLTMHPTNRLEAIVMTAMTTNADGTWRPYVQGQLKTLLPYFWDITGYLYNEVLTEQNVLDPTSVPVQTKVRRLLIESGMAGFEAGERVGGALPGVITEPNIADMIDTIFGGLPVIAPPTPPTVQQPQPQVPDQEQEGVQQS